MADRTYETEFRHGYDIPWFIRFLVNRGILEDQSWHNDAAPSFGVTGTLKLGPKEWSPKKAEYRKQETIRIWVEHPMKSLREIPAVTRFAVSRMTDLGDNDSWDFNELQEALEKLFSVIVENHPNLEDLPEAWSNLIENYDGNPGEILSALLEEYDRKG
jgi:hypothetical protein